jgi:hypothetical protein
MATDNDKTIIPPGHTGFKIGADERGVPMTGPLGLAENADGQIIGRLVFIWPMGIAREQAQRTLTDMYATAMNELLKREDESKAARS